MTKQAPPRIYCIPASDAPVVAVFRRGPSNWAHVGRWDLAAGRYEPGAWLGGRIFPRRSDLSPDGQYLCYFAHKPSARWEHGEAYVAIAKLPWLTALHSFGTCGTWTRGYYFTQDGRGDEPMSSDAAGSKRRTLLYATLQTPGISIAMSACGNRSRKAPVCCVSKV
jgi:hypothetical protein